MKTMFLVLILSLVSTVASAQSFITNMYFDPGITLTDETVLNLTIDLLVPNDCWFAASSVQVGPQEIDLVVLDRSEQIPSCSTYYVSATTVATWGPLAAGHYEYTIKETHSSGTEPWYGTSVLAFDVQPSVPDALDSWGTIKARYR